MSGLGWAAAWRIARRDLDVRLRGLRLLFACLFLGVATLAAIGSLTSAITDELATRGRVLLGGDVEVAMTQREIGAAGLAALRGEGVVSETIRLRAMVQGATGSTPLLTELKGVDGAYPLYGTLALERGAYRPLAPDAVLIGRSLAQRMQVAAGTRLRWGSADFTVAGIIADEPDRVGEGFTLGPVAIVSMAGMRRTGLIQPGSLYEAKYRLRLPAGAEAEGTAERLAAANPDAGWEIKHHGRAAPGAARFFARMGQFLTLIGLAALVIAGIGVRNGVAAYLGGKRGSIATLKVLGATSANIARIHALQLAAVGAAAIVAGLATGALLPPAIVWAAGDVLPVRPGLSIHPLPLATSALYGGLIAAIFTLPPLARARTEPAASLFRGVVERAGRGDRRTMSWVAGAAALLLVVAVGTAREPVFSAAVLGAVAAVLALLLAMGWGVSALAKRLPRPRRPLLRLALANLHRPGAQTSALIVALGLALTLFVTLATIQTALARQIRETVPARAPDLFVLDVPSGETARLRQVVARGVGTDAAVNIVPVLRGTITGYGGTRVSDLAELPDGAWFLRGERGVTYSPVLPEGSDLVAGAWWAEDYLGPPLVSLDAEAARTMGVGVGDMLTVSVLGREVEARIASLRRVNWDTMGFNYIMVFSPATFAAAPHSLSATITGAEGAPPVDAGAVTRTLLAAFPGASVIEVGEVVGQVRAILDQMAQAIVAAASIAILAGIAVLVGAIAASRQARAYDSVILKTLGATRAQILGTQAVEYAVLAGLLAAVALALGTLAGWYVMTQVFGFGFTPDWGVVLATLLGGAAITLGIGLAGSVPLMAVRPAAALRSV